MLLACQSKTNYHMVRASRSAAPPLNGAGSWLACAYVAAESACAVALGALRSGLIIYVQHRCQTHTAHTALQANSRLSGHQGTSVLVTSSEVRSCHALALCPT